MALALALTGPASAAAVIYTYRGTISGVFDYDGTAFGGAIAPGDAFTAVFTREDKPGATQFYNGPPYGASYISGEGIDNPVSAKLNIGNLSLDIGQGNSPGYSTGRQFQSLDSDHPFWYSNLYAFDSNHYDNGLTVRDISHELTIETYSIELNSPKSSNYHDLNSLSVSRNPELFWRGQYAFGESAYDSSTFAFSIHRLGYLALAPTSLTVGVPEPATWMLMIGGFGLAGAMLRRRRGAPAQGPSCATASARSIS